MGIVAWLSIMLLVIAQWYVHCDDSCAKISWSRLGSYGDMDYFTPDLFVFALGISSQLWASILGRSLQMACARGSSVLASRA